METRKTRGTLFSGVLAVGIATAVTSAFAVVDYSDANNGQAKKAANNLYIVRMAERPVVAYEGDIPGYALMPRGGLCSTTVYYRQLTA